MLATYYLTILIAVRKYDYFLIWQNKNDFVSRKHLIANHMNI